MFPFVLLIVKFLGSSNEYVHSLFEFFGISLLKYLHHVSVSHHHDCHYHRDLVVDLHVCHAGHLVKHKIIESKYEFIT